MTCTVLSSSGRICVRQALVCVFVSVASGSSRVRVERSQSTEGERVVAERRMPENSHRLRPTDDQLEITDHREGVRLSRRQSVGGTLRYQTIVDWQHNDNDLSPITGTTAQLMTFRSSATIDKIHMENCLFDIKKTALQFQGQTRHSAGPALNLWAIYVYCCMGNLKCRRYCCFSM